MGETTTQASTRTAVTGTERDFLAGMGREWLLPLYDPMTRLYGVQRIHRRLLDQAELRPGQRVLEIGCGTANLLLAAKRSEPGLLAVGLDPDLAALARAHRKARRRHLAVQLDRGYADELPYPDDSLDVVLSSFMLHHLPADQQDLAAREVLRVLRPGGALHVVDVGGGHPHDSAQDHEHGPIRHRGHRRPTVRSHHGAPVPDLLRRAGFADVAETGSGMHRRVGRFTLVRATA